MATFTLLITKKQLTEKGWLQDENERRGFENWRVRNQYTEEMAEELSGVVIHRTVLLEKSFKTIKAAWAYATSELIDGLGLVWDAKYATYSNEFTDYYVDVVKVR